MVDDFDEELSVCEGENSYEILLLKSFGGVKYRIVVGFSGKGGINLYILFLLF